MRTLTAQLDAIQLAQRRRPDWKVEIFDIRSTSNEPTPTRINDVVLFNLGLLLSLPASVGPRDFTDDVDRVQITEVAGDYTRQGVASTAIQCNVSDPDADLDPVENPAPGNGRWLRQGNVIVIREGDREIADTDWPMTFTGAIQGQPGQDFNRTTGNATLSAKASSREVDFLRRKSTSENFPQSTTFDFMANEIAETDMGLDADEINLPTLGSRLTAHRSTQFVDESPLTTIAKIMFPDGFMPRFEGDGRLGLTTGEIGKAPSRIYATSELPITITRPILEFNGTNDVEILGLDADLSKIVQQSQELATAEITTGFFSQDAAIPVAWSEDKTQQAQNVNFEILNSIAATLFPFGDEAFTETVQSDGGSVEGVVDVDGGIGGALRLVALIFTSMVSSLVTPDIAPQTPAGATAVIPFGRAVLTFVAKAIEMILAQVGRGQYRLNGEPYEYVFKEIRSVARIAGIRSEDREQVSVENHLINSQVDCDATAERVLRRERAKQNLRSVGMVFDLRLEPDDVFEVGTGIGARRYMINTLSRVLSRAAGDNLAQLQCFEVTPGVRP